MSQYRFCLSTLPAVVGLLTFASIAQAQIAFDAAASGSTLSGTTLSWSHTVGNGPNRVLVVGISRNDNSSATSVTYGGISLTRQVLVNVSPEVEMWTLIAPPSGAANVVVTFPSSKAIIGGSVSFTGVDQLTTIRDRNHTVGTSDVSVTTAIGDVVVDTLSATALGGDMVVSPDSSQTQRWNQTAALNNTSNTTIGAGSTKAGSAGSTEMDWAITPLAGFLNGANIAAISLIPGPACSGPSITSLAASPNILWPPNGTMAPVVLSDTISGGCGSVSCKILSVTSSEPIDAGGDWVFSGNPGDLNLTLRAQRLGTRVGTGNGRIYTITLQCTDALNNSTTKTVTVRVPHDQGH